MVGAIWGVASILAEVPQIGAAGIVAVVSGMGVWQLVAARNEELKKKDEEKKDEE